MQSAWMWGVYSVLLKTSMPDFIEEMEVLALKIARDLNPGRSADHHRWRHSDRRWQDQLHAHRERQFRSRSWTNGQIIALDIGGTNTRKRSHPRAGRRRRALRWAFRAESATMVSFTPCRTSISTTFLWPYLTKEFHLPSYVINDAEVAALAEANVGPFKKAKSLYFVTISTGVGGALYAIDGKLRNSSYEVGHTMTAYHGEVHEFEHMASGVGLRRLADMNGLEITDAREFFELVKNRRLARDDL
jgi:hypothetical protein